MSVYNPRPFNNDFNGSKEYEQLVGSWLPDPKSDQTDSTSKLDWVIPKKDGDIYVEVKEKNQKYNPANWFFPPDTIEYNGFIIDELSIMKALFFFPSVYFVLHDAAQGADRCFLAPIAYIIACKRETVDRLGKTKYPKGKWMCDLSQFFLLKDPAKELWPAIEAFEKEKPWMNSACLLPTH